MGGALLFNGTNQYVMVQDGPILGMSANLTVEAWINWKGGTGAQMIYCEGSFNDVINLYLRDGKPAFNVLGDNWHDITSPQPISAGQWHHVAGVLMNSMGARYVDGVIQASDPAMTSCSARAPSNPTSAVSRCYGGSRSLAG